MLDLLKRIEKIILGINKTIMTVLGVLLPAFIATGVFFRYVLKTDFFAIEEIEIYIAIWLYFVGSALASYGKSHISADLTQTMIKNSRIRKFFAILANFITVAIAIVITYCTIDLVTYAWKMKATSTAWKIPLVTEYIAVFYSMVLMAVYALRDFYHALSGHVSKGSCVDPS